MFLTEYCAKWWSDKVALGAMVMKGSQAGAGGLVATKALAKHIHEMSQVSGNEKKSARLLVTLTHPLTACSSQYSGVLLMKRAVCKNNKCAVFKSEFSKVSQL